MFIHFGDLQWEVLAFLMFASIVIYMFVSHFLYDRRLKWFLASFTLGVFFYSGFGIAYSNIDDSYAFNYIVFLFVFSIPFTMRRKNKNDSFVKNSLLDQVLIEKYKLLKKVAILFLLLSLLPLLYPEFRLFNIFTFKEGNIFDIKEARGGDVILVIVDKIKYMLTPFFYAFFTVEHLHKPKSKLPLFFFVLHIILEFGQYNYIARHEIIIDAVIIMLILYCVKGFDYNISVKHLIIFFVVLLCSIPFLFIYTFFREGVTYVGDDSFLKLLNLLVESEFSYPVYYDSIARRVEANGIGLINFVAYIICLPIPSVIWPDKPSYSVIGDFTYFVTGLARGDKDYYIVLPSIMGESFVCGGMEFYWVFAFISGIIFATIFVYLCKNKTLIFYTFYLIVYAFSYGRGGTTAIMPLIINGTVSIFLFEQYLKIKSIRK